MQLEEEHRPLQCHMHGGRGVGGQAVGSEKKPGRATRGLWGSWKDLRYYLQ